MGAIYHPVAPGEELYCYKAREFELLNGKATTGAGDTVQVRLECTEWTFQIKTTGSPSTVVVHLQGSKDGGQTWSNICTHCNNDMIISHIHDEAFSTIRAYVSALSGGTSPKVWAYVVAKQKCNI